MKKLFLICTLLFSSIYGCGLNAQAQGDELGIKNEKDFVKFIKSHAVDGNKTSERKGIDGNTTKVYDKKIKIGNSEFTITFSISDEYGNEIYSGNIIVKTTNPTNGRWTDFEKGKFEFMTHNDLILGKIRYFTGPGPYRSGSHILQQFANEKKAQIIEDMKSIPNLYEASYLLKGEFVFKPGKFKDEDYQEYEGEDEESRLQKRKKRFDDSVNVVKKNETERYTIVGTNDDGYFKFSLSPSSFNDQELKSYKIISVVRLVSKANFWVNNGSRDKWNYGYRLKLNPEKDNDTLVFKSWSPKLNGKIVDYEIVENEKFQMSTGEYKNGLPIGELIKYKLSDKFEKGRKTKIVESIEVYNSQGKPIKSTIYSDEFVSRSNDVYINYPSQIYNYDPITGKLNGLYQYFGLLWNSEVTDFKVLSTPIIRKTGNYLQGAMTGEWKEFFENGKLKSKTNYTTGESETYDENGELINKTYKKK